jgi:hypothetical protein
MKTLDSKIVNRKMPMFLFSMFLSASGQPALRRSFASARQGGGHRRLPGSLRRWKVRV